MPLRRDPEDGYPLGDDEDGRLGLHEAVDRDDVVCSPSGVVFVIWQLQRERDPRASMVSQPTRVLHHEAASFLLMDANHVTHPGMNGWSGCP